MQEKNKKVLTTTTTNSYINSFNKNKTINTNVLKTDPKGLLEYKILKLCIIAAIEITHFDHLNLYILPYKDIVNTDSFYLDEIFEQSLLFFEILSTRDINYDFLTRKYKIAFSHAYNYFTKEKVKKGEFEDFRMMGTTESISNLVEKYLKIDELDLIKSEPEIQLLIKLDKARNGKLGKNYELIEPVKQLLSKREDYVYCIKRTNPLSSDNLKIYNEVFLNRMRTEENKTEIEILYNNAKFIKSEDLVMHDNIDNYIKRKINNEVKSSENARQSRKKSLKGRNKKGENICDIEEIAKDEAKQFRKGCCDHVRIHIRENTKRNNVPNLDDKNSRSTDLLTSSYSKLCERLNNGFNINYHYLAILFLIIICLPKIQVAFGQPFSTEGCTYSTVSGVNNAQIDVILGYNDKTCMNILTPIGTFNVIMEFTSPTNAVGLDEPVYSLEMEKNHFNGNASGGNEKHYSCGCLSQPLSLSCENSKNVNCKGDIRDGVLCNICTVGGALRPDNGCLTVGHKLVNTVIKSNVDFRVRTSWNTVNQMINNYNVKFTVWALGEPNPCSITEFYSLKPGDKVQLPGVNQNVGYMMNLVVGMAQPIESYSEVINMFSSTGNMSDVDSLYLIPEEEILQGNPQKFLSMLIDRDGGVDNIHEIFTNQAILRTIGIKCFGNKANQYPYWRKLMELIDPSLNMKIIDNFDIYGAYTSSEGYRLLLFDVPNQFSFTLTQDITSQVMIPPVVSVLFMGMTCNTLNVYNSGVICKVLYRLTPNPDTNPSISFMITINGDIKGPFVSLASQTELYLKLDDNEAASTSLVCISIPSTSLVNCGVANLTITNKTLDDPNGIFDDGIIDIADDGPEAKYMSNKDKLLAILIPVIFVSLIVIIAMVMLVIKKTGYGFKESWEIWKMEREEKMLMWKEKQNMERKKLRERIQGRVESKPLIDKDIKLSKLKLPGLSDIEYI